MAQALAQPLDETWTVTVGGQSVQVNSDGSFRIPNVSAADLFGPGGPGTRPDFLSDDFLRLTGHGTVDGKTRYVFSDPFQIRQGQVYVFTNLTYTDNPPPLPVSIRAVPDQPTLTATGPTTQVRVSALLPDGISTDVTPREAWTIYRTSNPMIATIDRDGLVTAQSRGMAFLTAVNEGATAVTQVDVSPGDPLTSVRGFVQRENGEPVEGAEIQLAGVSGQGISEEDGHFVIDGVATGFGIPGIIARLDRTEVLMGWNDGLTPVPGGITDAGIIVIRTVCEGFGGNCIDTDRDCLPDVVEQRLRLNPENPDSNGNGVPDGAEDSDGDGINNCLEIFLGTDPGRSDTDGDGLNDRQEVYDTGTDPLRTDTDGDDLSDGDELAQGTDAFDRDTDNDGWTDGIEVFLRSDPLEVVAIPSIDADGDGFMDWDEEAIGTDPENAGSQPQRYTETRTFSFLNALVGANQSNRTAFARPVSVLNALVSDTQTNRTAVAVPVSYLNARQGEGSTDRTVYSSPMSYLNALLEPGQRQRPAFAQPVSYLNALFVEEGGERSTFAPPVSYLNGIIESNEAERIQLSPIVSYENQE